MGIIFKQKMLIHGVMGGGIGGHSNFSDVAEGIGGGLGGLGPGGGPTQSGVSGGYGLGPGGGIRDISYGLSPDAIAAVAKALGVSVPQAQKTLSGPFGQATMAQLGLNFNQPTTVAVDPGYTNPTQTVEEAINAANSLGFKQGLQQYGKPAFSATLAATGNPVAAAMAAMLGTAYGYHQSGAPGPTETTEAAPGYGNEPGDRDNEMAYTIPSGENPQNNPFWQWTQTLAAQPAGGTTSQQAQDNRFNLMDYDPMSRVNPDLVSMITNQNLFGQLVPETSPMETIDPYADPRYGMYKNSAEQQYETARKSIMANLPQGGALLNALAGADLSKARALTDYTGTLTQDLADKRQAQTLAEMAARISLGQSQIGAASGLAGQQLGTAAQFGLGQLSSDTQKYATDIAAQTQLEAARLGATTQTNINQAVIDAQEDARWNQLLMDLGTTLADADWW